MTVEPGVYNMPMDDYLDLEAVSSSLIRNIVQQCPLAALHRSVFNPNRPKEEITSAQLLGSAAHALLLEGNADQIVVVETENWRTNAAKEIRDNAIAEGKIPLLPGGMHIAKAMARMAREFVESLKDTDTAVWRAFQPGGGDPEVTIVWQDGETLCKIRPDLLSKGRETTVHYKTTASLAEPEYWGRTQYIRMFYYGVAAFYAYGIENAFGVQSSQYFLVQEQNPPYLCSLIGLDDNAYKTGMEKIRIAMDAWERCAKEGMWYGYPRSAVYPEIPNYERFAWENTDDQT